MRKFFAVLFAAAVVVLTSGCAQSGIADIVGEIARSLPTASPSAEYKSRLENFQSETYSEFVENRALPEAISETFGPRTEPIYEITITSGDDLMEQFIKVMNGRAETVRINMPLGTEEFYINELKEQISRFTDITSMSTRWIKYSGVCTVDITYNDAAKIMAYLEGKTSELSEDNRLVLDAAVKIHDEIINTEMSSYDKVRAYHDYIINAVSYRDTGDRGHSVVGALVDGQCVCEGYTEALDLLCYLSGIECIEVSGTGETEGVLGPHAWNKVKLGNLWYNVDVTWDDPVSSVPVLRHDYFLVSDDKIAEDHEWYLYDHIPESPVNYE